MPKQKTNSGAKKKFKVTGNGEAPAPDGGPEPQSGAQVAEAEAGVP